MKPRVLDFENVVTWIAALPSGELVVLHYAKDASERRLVCLSPDGQPLWTKNLALGPNPLRWPYYRWPVRVAGNGTIWVGYPEELRGFDARGEQVAAIPLKLHEAEQLGTFVVADDAVVVALGAQFMGKGKQDPRIGRLVCLSLEGKLLSSTELNPKALEFKGVHVMSAETVWQSRPHPPWQPEGWEPDGFDPLLVAGDYVLATYSESGSGIARSYCVRDGQVLWTTEPRPNGNSAIDGNGNFVIGTQGYGAFECEVRRPTTGEVLGSWRTHGPVVVDAAGRTCIMEMDNGARGGHFVRLGVGGAVERGPKLAGYYTAYPAMSAHGVTYLCRAGELVAIDADLRKTVLYTGVIPNRSNSLMLTRVLITGDTLLFGADRSLLIFDGQFGELARSNWPCEGANLGGNPRVDVHHA